MPLLDGSIYSNNSLIGLQDQGAGSAHPSSGPSKHNCLQYATFAFWMSISIAASQPHASATFSSTEYL